MRDFVIDANVLMSILISGKAIYRQLLKQYSFFSSDFAFIEIEKYQELIKEKSKLDSDSFQEFSYFVFSNVNFMPSYIINENAKQKAVELVKDIDIKDVSYIALSLQLNLILLTRDIPLYQGLQKKSYRNVQLFNTFLQS